MVSTLGSVLQLETESGSVRGYRLAVARPKQYFPFPIWVEWSDGKRVPRADLGLIQRFNSFHSKSVLSVRL